MPIRQIARSLRRAFAERACGSCCVQPPVRGWEECEVADAGQEMLMSVSEFQDVVKKFGMYWLRLNSKPPAAAFSGK